MRFRLSAAFALALAGAVSISCGGIVDPSQNNVEPFNDTVQPANARSFWFSASKTGEIQMKMLTLTPASTQYLGVLWVQGNSDKTCNSGSILQNNQFATAGTTAISGQIPSGNYCIIVYDSKGLTQPASFTSTVSHP